MRSVISRISRVLLAGLAAAAPAVTAESQALIDRQLETEIDFRSIAYSACVGQSTCTIGEISITAQRRDDFDEAWIDDAILYWDPVDGIGVEGGGQNDEIDFDERIIVELGGMKAIEGVWLSDFFRDEDARYNAGLTQRVVGLPEDSEIAGIAFMRGEAGVFNQVAASDDPLPLDPFNQLISQVFHEDGDLLRRVIIHEDTVTMIVPGENLPGRIRILEMTLGQIDKDKQDLFEGLLIEQIELAEIIRDFRRARFFALGTQNFKQIAALLEKRDSLEDIKVRAEDLRQTAELSNGEFLVRSEFDEPVDRLVFFAPFDSSNDFSVAGIVLVPVDAVALAK